MGFLDSYKKTKVWQTEADATAPKKGDIAPDFELKELDGITTCRLSDYRGKKPVVLVFGSHT
jgi:peroxiredoxin